MFRCDSCTFKKKKYPKNWCPFCCLKQLYYCIEVLSLLCVHLYLFKCLKHLQLDSLTGQFFYCFTSPQLPVYRQYWPSASCRGRNGCRYTEFLSFVLTTSSCSSSAAAAPAETNPWGAGGPGHYAMWGHILTSSPPHPPCHILPVTSSRSHPTPHILPVTSYPSHPPRHILPVTSSPSHPTRHILPVTSSLSHPPRHILPATFSRHILSVKPVTSYLSGAEIQVISYRWLHTGD